MGLSKKLEATNNHKFFNEELRVQDCDVSSATDQRIGVGAEGMVNVEADQFAVLVCNRLQQIVHHFPIGRSCHKEQRR